MPRGSGFYAAEAEEASEYHLFFCNIIGVCVLMLTLEKLRLYC